MEIEIREDKVRFAVGNVIESIIRETIIENIKSTDMFHELILDAAKNIIQNVIDDDDIISIMKKAIKEDIEQGYIFEDDDVTKIITGKIIESINKM